ncbi:MAG: hypothetical protein B7X90_02850 [Novosphingobium sp. 17-62-19]|uniref:hypothetical protein n=1 Tax=Novosphingobium sp. 17-62-19 TaxID=1970406 RepID=UPI000BD72807|nr:hypothetical protein [Novosphingobium sp. 17-62-19]OZA21190.1 MAG: hypothetical protein B7X90_02850 [Novosphingobium sp. 17-62-19]HQS96359.1 hypothetical protein [Novosphingobium sp.]
MLSNMQNPGWRAGASRELVCLGRSQPDSSDSDVAAQTCHVRADRHAASGLKLHRNGNSGEVSNDLNVGKDTENPAIHSQSSRIAIEPPYIGDAAKFTATSLRGGAHNRADRESRRLTTDQVGKLMAAAKHADAIGLPLTRFITIHWASAGVVLDEMVKATGRFIDLLAKALKRYGSETAWLYVHEGREREGGHCHLLAHVPARLVAAVSKLQKGWLHRITGRTYRKGVICSKPIGGRLRLEWSNPALFAANFETVFKYLLKGVNEESAELFDIHSTKPTGRIMGKRCGTSQNIGAKARKDKELQP